MNNTIENLQNRILELEHKVAFQELGLEELNQALTQQQFTLEKMQNQFSLILNKLQGMQTSNIASLAEETPPPHY